MLFRGREAAANLCQSFRKCFSHTKAKKRGVPLPVALANRTLNDDELMSEYRFACPEFLPSQRYGTRNHLFEKLQRMDMLRRRERIEIPEFYVGSILAVTMSVPYTASKLHRFVGICIQRDLRGLRHYITLRNVIHNEGFEVRYDLYNPTLVSIEVLKLEKRLDDELLYLRDALPKYSTFPFDMEAQPHQPGTPVPVNELKVRFAPWNKFDLISEYKVNATADDLGHVVRQIDQQYGHSTQRPPPKA
ncbi:hypothetical protein M514_12653 [Trichuris suis]|uniref:Large ribosomal subunit protein bL19m n=1 Tax=Trichuris suis TaxID=68888 RepID=A0A085N3Q3_9BILA|nr:hypothetical protein M514_12653 [Trichuris suis]